MTDLTSKTCRPCEGGVPPLSRVESLRLLGELRGWSLEGERIRKDYTFTNFVEAMTFVNAVADIAEAERHHPDIHIHWNRVRLELWTHAIGGLSENDFIVAAKADALNPGATGG